MRTNIELNSKLVKEAFCYTSVTTKRELIEQALLEFVQNHRSFMFNTNINTLLIIQYLHFVKHDLKGVLKCIRVKNGPPPQT